MATFSVCSTEAVEDVEQAVDWDGTTIYDIAPGDDLDELVELFNGAVVYIYREKSDPEHERILRLMEGTKKRVDSKLRAQKQSDTDESTYALGWFRLDIDRFLGENPEENDVYAMTAEDRDSMEPEYLFMAYG